MLTQPQTDFSENATGRYRSRVREYANKAAVSEAANVKAERWITNASWKPYVVAL